MRRAPDRLLAPTAARTALSTGLLLGLLLGLLGLLGLLTGCGTDDEPEALPTPVVTATPEPTPTPAPAPAPTPAVSPSSAAEPSSSPEPSASAEPTSAAGALADGRYPAHLTAVDVDGREITFDVVQFLTGAAAAQAAAEDGAESPPPNDYYIRNASHTLRTLPIPTDATITVNTLESGTTGDSTKNVTISLGRLASYQGLADHTFWLTVADGVITLAEEQYLP